MTTHNATTYWRLVVWPLFTAFSRSVEYDAGVVALYTAALSSPQTFPNARRTSTDDTNLMGRFFYYRYRHVVLHTVVDHRFL